jgi:hypothetical protein
VAAVAAAVTADVAKGGCRTAFVAAFIVVVVAVGCRDGMATNGN